MSTPESTDSPTSQPLPLPVKQASYSLASLTVAVIWAALAVIFAGILLGGAKDEVYGGEAYTGIQNAVMLAARGIAFLLFASAALGVIIALRRDGR
ncbi:MAG: hypothetical protein JWR53_1705 [Glaciihabitans sp.]|nr:hypothetical protein [Glaciihabitans sp.]